MIQRIDYNRIAPEAVKALSGLTMYVRSRKLDERLQYLLEIRISQINGCAYCVDLHSQQAREAGESQQRLDCLATWQEAPFYTEPERAALGWAESVTLVAQSRVPDSTYQQARQHFSEEELVDLTMVAVAMNGWNRFAISFRKLPVERSEPMR